MSSWVISVGDQSAFALSAAFTRYMGIGGFIQSRVEVDVQHRIRHTCNLTKLLVRVSTNTHDGSDVVTLRVNGAAGNLTLTVPSLATGVFEDLSNTDLLSDGDLVATEIASGGTVGILDLTLVSYVLTDPAGDRHYVMGQARGGAGETPSFGSTIFGRIGGRVAHNRTTEADAQYRLRFATTLDRFRIVVASNTIDGTSTFRTRVNGVNGNQTFTVGALATGEFEDTTNSDTITSGDLVNSMLVTLGTTGVIEVSYTQIRMDAVGRPTISGTDAGAIVFTPGGGNRFPAIEDGLLTNSLEAESNASLRARIRYNARNYHVFVVSNTAEPATVISLRVQETTSLLSVTIPSLATGEFEDLVNTIEVTEDQEVNHLIDVSALTEGSISLAHVGFQQDAVEEVEVASPSQGVVGSTIWGIARPLRVLAY